MRERVVSGRKGGVTGRQVGRQVGMVSEPKERWCSRNLRVGMEAIV